MDDFFSDSDHRFQKKNESWEKRLDELMARIKEHLNETAKESTKKFFERHGL